MTTSHTLSHAERVRHLFAAVDTRDPAAPLEHLTDDIRFRFGNGPEVNGKAEFERGGVDFFGSLGGIRHDVTALWEPEPDVAIAEMQVHYTRLDGSRISLPCVNVFRFRDDLIADYVIYMDIGPVFNP